jgi:CubicO group peptidase (beta-lactamase class C family)
MRPVTAFLITAGVVLFAGVRHVDAESVASGNNPNVKAFVEELRALAGEHHLPGLSAALVRQGEVIWSGGFGLADIENGVPAGADTPYRLASLSKPFAAVILMQLVEEKRLDLDAMMRDFTIHSWFEPGGGSWAHYPSRYTENDITVRHVLTHTSQSQPPGDAYNYSGNIFADLTWVIESVTGLPYPTVVEKRILEPLGMTRSSPGHLMPSRQDVVRAIAKPYAVKDGEPSPGTYPGFGLDPDVDVSPWHLDPAYRLPVSSREARHRLLGDSYTPLYSLQTAAGMIATVEDIARFDIALDSGKLISEASRHRMFTAARTSSGSVLPYGLGWFVEDHGGTAIVWHYGWFPPTVSALLVKVPDKELTLILLSNSDGLSADVSWSALGVRASPFARVFLEHFVAE